MNAQRGFEGALGRIGERDAARELYRARAERRRAQRAKHDEVPTWQYKTVSGNRKGRNR